MNNRTRVSEALQAVFYSGWDFVTQTLPEIWNDQRYQRIIYAAGGTALGAAAVIAYTTLQK
jgi:hypothetical protein